MDKTSANINDELAEVLKTSYGNFQQNLDSRLEEQQKFERIKGNRNYRKEIEAKMKLLSAKQCIFSGLSRRTTTRCNRNVLIKDKSGKIGKLCRNHNRQVRERYYLDLQPEFKNYYEEAFVMDEVPLFDDEEEEGDKQAIPEVPDSILTQWYDNM